MAVTQPLSEEITLLLKEKGKTCISVLLPLHNLSIDQKADKLHIERAIKDLSNELKDTGQEEYDQLIDAISELQQGIVFNRNDEGIGLFVSTGICFYTTFPFPVPENISVDTSFRIRELLLKQQFSIPYNVLYVDEKEIRLFTGILRQLKEIKNGEFPMIFHDNYEYQPSSRSTSYAGQAHVKSFEKDKNALEKTRHDSFILEADDLLGKHMLGPEIIILCGTKRYTSAFVNRTIHANKIAGIINGNYAHYDEKDFASMIWPSVNAFINEQMIDSVNDYSEKVGEGLVEEGILPVWDAVLAGRGDTLLVEKSYQLKGYLLNHHSWQLVLEPPKKQHTVLADAVNYVMETVLEKKGKIMFLEDGMLGGHSHIALITRY